MVGLDLADFYLDLGQVQTAVTFLADALKTFQNDGWEVLKVKTLMKAADCYEALADHERVVRTSSQIMCGAPLMVTPQERSIYFEKFSASLKASGKVLFGVKEHRDYPVF